MDEKGLGRRLQDARAAAGLTQQALCQKAHLSYSTLTKIERGAIKAPSIFTIQNIADALGVSLNELLGVADKRMPKQGKLTSKSGVTFVYFDINGCLVRFFHRAFTRLSEETGAPPDVVETTYWHYNDQACRGDIDMATLNAKLAETLKSPHPIDWVGYYLDAAEPIPAMHELARWTCQNYRCGLLTNIMPGLVDAMMERGILPRVPFDAIVDSSVVHAIKPESKIYTIATAKADVPAGEILLIDDSRVNLMAAEKHGWRVLWFDEYRVEESISRIRSALEPA